MSKINKLITNKPVTLTEEEVTNLSKTLSAVQTAGGGGGGGGRVYYGDNSTISVNQIDGIISLTTEATEKLNTPIPTKVSDLTDYEDYQTVDKMSAYLTTAQYNSDSAKFATKTELETTAAIIMGLIPSTAGLASEAWVTAQGYLTQVPDTYYLKTETSGKDELSAAFDAILNYDVTAAAGIKITTATDNGTTTFGISMTAEPVITDTNLSGYNGIAAAPDGTKSGWWNVGLTQDMLNTINGKLDSSDFTTYTGTTAPATYQPKGDYATEQYVQGASADVTAWVNNQNYLKTVPSEYITETELSTALTNYVTSSTTAITGTDQFALTTAGWAKVQAGSTFTGVETTGAISGTGIAGSEIGLVDSATSALDLISDQYQIDGSQYITVVPNTATKKVVIGLDNQVSNAIDTVTANANIWNNASAVSAKSHTTIDNTTNIITTENQGTSASLSAIEYKDNVNVAGMNVQQIYAVRSDGDIFACLSTTANKGTLFFVCSGV